MKYIVRIEDTSTALKGTASDGGDRGATILYKIGRAGSLYGDPGYNEVTAENLWPFPYEAVTHTWLNAYSYTGPKLDGTSGTLTGNRGFAADGQTLTKYIWSYLGYPSPY